MDCLRANPLIVGGRPYTIRIRLPDENRGFAGRRLRHGVQFEQRSYRDAGFDLLR